MNVWPVDGVGGCMPLFLACINVDKFYILDMPYWNHLDSVWEGFDSNIKLASDMKVFAYYFHYFFFPLRSAMSERYCIPFKKN